MLMITTIKIHLSPVYRTAKSYYDTRLKVLREHNAEKRNQTLMLLNQIQPTLDTLEGNIKFSYFERKKMLAIVQETVKKVKLILKYKPQPSQIQVGTGQVQQNRKVQPQKV